MIAIVTATYLRNGHYHVEEIQMVSRCTMASSVALNCVQGQVKRENYSRTSAYSQLHAFSSPGCGLTIRAMPEIIEQKPQKSMTEHAERLWRRVGDSFVAVAFQSYLIRRPKPEKEDAQ